MLGCLQVSINSVRTGSVGGLGSVSSVPAAQAAAAAAAVEAQSLATQAAQAQQLAQQAADVSCPSVCHTSIQLRTFTWTSTFPAHTSLMTLWLTRSAAHLVSACVTDQ